MTVTHLTKQLNHKNTRAIDRLRALYENMFLLQPQNNYTGCMINNMMSELGTTNKLVSTATAIEFEHFLDVVELCVKEDQNDGDLNPKISSRALTELLHSTFYGALTRVKSLQDYTNGMKTMNLLINSLKTIKT